MSKPNQTDIERFYVEKVLARLGLCPVSVSSVEDDPPDVRVELGDRVIGVEVMDYHRDWTERSSELRRQEARVDEIEEAFHRARGRFPEVTADGRVWFRQSHHTVAGVSPDRLLLMPGESEVDAFVEQLLAYAKTHAAEWAVSVQLFHEFGDAFPLLRQYVEKVEIRCYSWTPIWNFAPRARTHGFAGEQWTAHVRRKSTRIRKAQKDCPGRFEGYDEIWLLLVSGPRSSQSVAATLGHFAGDNDLMQELEGAPFETVLVYQCWKGMPLYKWRRAEGWTEVRDPS